MSPAELAARVLQHYSPSLPVNVHRIIRAEGIILRIVHTNPDFNGMYIRLLDEPFIYVNGNHPRNRRTFTLAHELYHHFESKRGAWHGRPMFHLGRDPETHPETRADIREERQANRFAAALLMPDEAVRAMACERLTAAQMARQFGVSKDAMEIRLAELGL